MTNPLLSPVALDLVDDIRSAVPAGPGQVARAVEKRLFDDDLLRPWHRRSDPVGYRQHILHVEPDGSFSVVALVWLPGQSTPVHDHVSWCVVGTYLGEEEETTYDVVDGHLVPLLTTTTPRGVAAHLTPPGDIHTVRNACDAKAISIHVYGADVSVLGSSIRRRYDLPVLDRVSMA